MRAACFVSGGCAPVGRLTRHGGHYQAATVADTNGGGGGVMTTDRTQNHTDRAASDPTAPVYASGGAAIHPRFLRSGPWALSSVVALLFGLSFATSYAALYGYALELEFSREFAIAFPLVLDAVIIVLAVTLLLERALGRRTMTLLVAVHRPLADLADGSVVDLLR